MSVGGFVEFIFFVEIFSNPRRGRSKPINNKKNKCQNDRQKGNQITSFPGQVDI